MQLPRPVTKVFIDAKAAQQFLSEPLHTSRARHISIRLLFTREHYDKGDFDFEKISGEKNPADALTKPISAERMKIYFNTLLMPGGLPVYVVADAPARHRKLVSKRELEGTHQGERKKGRLASEVLEEAVARKRA